MRRRWFVGGLAAGLAALVPGVGEAKKRPPARAPEADATLAARVKQHEVEIADLKRRLSRAGL